MCVRNHHVCTGRLNFIYVDGHADFFFFFFFFLFYEIGWLCLCGIFMYKCYVIVIKLCNKDDLKNAFCFCLFVCFFLVFVLFVDNIH